MHTQNENTSPCPRWDGDRLAETISKLIARINIPRVEEIISKAAEQNADFKELAGVAELLKLMHNYAHHYQDAAELFVYALHVEDGELGSYLRLASDIISMHIDEDGCPVEIKRDLLFTLNRFSQQVTEIEQIYGIHNERCLSNFYISETPYMDHKLKDIQRKCNAFIDGINPNLKAS